MKKILFVHGFGVMGDSRGLFTDIGERLSSLGYVPVFFDMNSADADGNMTVQPLREQAHILESVYMKEIERGDECTIIAHSQGCAVTALAQLPCIQKTFFLAPPIETNSQKTIEYFTQNAKTKIDLTGVSELARRDGSITFVPSAYFKEKDSLSFGDLYKEYAASTETVVVAAMNDEVIDISEYTKVFKEFSDILEVQADHNFTKDSRRRLIELLTQYI